MINPTPKVNARYGAPMGRPSFGHGADPTTPFSLVRVPLNSGGYDRGGAYWGIGQPLYWYCAYETGEVAGGNCLQCGASSRYALNSDMCAYSNSGHHKFPMVSEEVEISDYIRADDREHAKSIIRVKYPNAKFKR